MTQQYERIHVHIGSDERVQAEITSLLNAAGRKAHFLDEHDVLSVLPDVDVLLCGFSPRVDWSLARRLRLLHFMGAGVDHLWPAQGLDPRVVIANARGVHAMEMRDHTLGMLLAFERDLPRAMQQQANRHWEPFVAGSLTGKTLGIVGLGEIGRPIAAAAQALGMRVLGVRNRVQPTPNVDVVFAPSDLSQVLRAADYFVVVAPLTPHTRGMIGPDELALLPSHAVIVVISRGGIVDEAALAQMLRDKRLRGAAFDVFASEPLDPSSPLWETPNLLITPHCSGLVPHYVERSTSLFLTNLKRFERGETVLTPVDRERWY